MPIPETAQKNINLPTVENCNLLCKLILDYMGTNECKIQRQSNQSFRIVYPAGSFINYRDTSYELTYAYFFYPSRHSIDGEKYDLEINIYHGKFDSTKGIVAHTHYHMDYEDTNRIANQHKHFHYHLPEDDSNSVQVHTNHNTDKNVVTCLLYNKGKHVGSDVNIFFNQFIHHPDFKDMQTENTIKTINVHENWSIEQLYPKKRSFFMYDDDNTFVVFDTIQTISKEIIDRLYQRGIKKRDSDTTTLFDIKNSNFNFDTPPRVLYRKNIEVITDPAYKKSKRAQIKDLLSLTRMSSYKPVKRTSKEYNDISQRIVEDISGGVNTGYLTSQDKAKNVSANWEIYGRDIPSEIEAESLTAGEEIILNGDVALNYNYVQKISKYIPEIENGIPEADIEGTTTPGPKAPLNYFAEDKQTDYLRARKSLTKLYSIWFNWKYHDTFYNESKSEFKNVSIFGGNDYIYKGNLMGLDSNDSLVPRTNCHVPIADFVKWNVNNTGVYPPSYTGTTTEPQLCHMSELHRDDQNWKDFYNQYYNRSGDPPGSGPPPVAKNLFYRMLTFYRLFIVSLFYSQNDRDINKDGDNPPYIYKYFFKYQENATVSLGHGDIKEQGIVNIKNRTQFNRIIEYVNKLVNENEIYLKSLKDNDNYSRVEWASLPGAPPSPEFSAASFITSEIAVERLLNPSSFEDNTFSEILRDNGISTFKDIQELFQHLENAKHLLYQLSGVDSAPSSGNDVSLNTRQYTRALQLRVFFEDIDTSYQQKNNFTSSIYSSLLSISGNTQQSLILNGLANTNDSPTLLPAQDSFKSILQDLGIIFQKRGEIMERTLSNEKCQHWLSHEVHYEGDLWKFWEKPEKITKNEEFEYGKLSTAYKEKIGEGMLKFDTEDNKWKTHNECRNPGNRAAGPWCYTTNPNKRWEYCQKPYYSNIFGKIVLFLVFIFIGVIAFFTIKTLFLHEYPMKAVAKITGGTLASKDTFTQGQGGTTK